MKKQEGSPRIPFGVRGFFLRESAVRRQHISQPLNISVVLRES